MEKTAKKLILNLDDLIAENTENERINFTEIEKKIIGFLPKILEKIGNEKLEFENFSVSRNEKGVVFDFQNGLSLLLNQKNKLCLFSKNSTIGFFYFLKDAILTDPNGELFKGIENNQNFLQQILDAFSEILEMENPPEKSENSAEKMAAEIFLKNLSEKFQIIIFEFLKKKFESKK